MGLSAKMNLPRNKRRMTKKKKSTRKTWLTGEKVQIKINFNCFCRCNSFFFLDLVEPSSKKKKVQYLYRTTEEVIEEMSKSGVHRMAREYR